MTTSPILRAFSRLLVALLAVVSVFLLLRGHNEPGGGFIGGLLMASALAVHALAHGPASAREKLGLDPRTLSGAGLVLALGSGLIALALGRPLMTGLWLPLAIPGIGKLGTVTLFDVGVFLVVVGTSLQILLTVWCDAEDESDPGSAGERR